MILQFTEITNQNQVLDWITSPTQQHQSTEGNSNRGESTSGHIFLDSPADSWEKGYHILYAGCLDPLAMATTTTISV